MDLFSIAITFGIVLASLTVHEAAHAWSADRLGDPTARTLGRLSLNPIVHIDPIGTVVLPLLAIFSTGHIFGWAKPVPVNVSRLRDPKRDFMLVAAAGPASNILLAVAGAVLFRSLDGYSQMQEPFFRVLSFAISINVLLAVFNMLPVPPLDGGNVLAGVLPDRYAAVFDALRRYGFLILLALIMSGVLWQVIGPVIDFIESLLL